MPTVREFWFGVIAILLGIAGATGILIHQIDTHSATVSVSVPAIQPAATKAPAAQTTVPAQKPIPTQKPLYTGNPFVGPAAKDNAIGGTEQVYSCAKGLTQVDLPVGKSYTSRGTQIIITDQREDHVNQDGITVGIKLDASTAMPGMIVLTNSFGDTLYHTFAPRLLAGSSASYPLKRSAYDTSGYDEIYATTFCLQNF
jgi:hypothetical protein